MFKCCFEKVKRFEEDKTINLPERKTALSAGYDFEVAEDIIIPRAETHITNMSAAWLANNDLLPGQALTLEQVAALTKTTKAKPTLVPTGIKAKIPVNTYLQLSVRSSCPLKSWLILANGVGIIDADYYGNESNDGEIFFQIINLAPFDIQLKKGDIIGQGVIIPYFTTDNDAAFGARTGGFGSTT